MATPRVAASPVPSELVWANVELDRYLDATARRYQDQLVRALAKLAEPSARVASDPTRALRVVGCCVETLAGFARGAALEPLAATLRRHTDDAGKRRLRELVATGIAARGGTIDDRATATGAAATALVAVPRLIADADRRPLVDEFGARLNLRLAAALVDLRAIARTLATAATYAVPEATAAAIAALADDDTAALRFGDQLGYGWGTCLAALARARVAPAIAHARSRALWAHWWRCVRGEHVAREAEYRVGEARSALTPADTFLQIG